MAPLFTAGILFYLAILNVRAGKASLLRNLITAYIAITGIVEVRDHVAMSGAGTMVRYCHAILLHPAASCSAGMAMLTSAAACVDAAHPLRLGRQPLRAGVGGAAQPRRQDELAAKLLHAATSAAFTHHHICCG